MINFSNTRHKITQNPSQRIIYLKIFKIDASGNRERRSGSTRSSVAKRIEQQGALDHVFELPTSVGGG